MNEKPISVWMESHFITCLVRIGLIHEGAKKVLDSGKTLYIHSSQTEYKEGVQPGINLPIVFQDKVIGVIGVTGDPHEMEDIGELVKMTTELIIKQEFIASQVEWQQRMKDIIIEELLKKQPSYTNIERGLDFLDFTFKPPYMTITIQLKDREMSDEKLIRILENSLGEKSGIISFITVNRILIAICGIDENKADSKINKIHFGLKKTNINFRMAYSIPFEDIQEFYQSYADCDLTLKVSEEKEELVSFANIEVKSLVYQLEETLATRFYKRILKDYDKVRYNTLKAFFKHNLNIQKTADSIYLHRNTMIYRLDKIYKETGYNPRKFEDAINLQIALWIEENYNQSYTAER